MAGYIANKRDWEIVESRYEPASETVEADFEELDTEAIEQTVSASNPVRSAPKPVDSFQPIHGTVYPTANMKFRGNVIEVTIQVPYDDRAMWLQLLDFQRYPMECYIRPRIRK